MERDIALRVNGAAHRLRVDPDTPLIYILRNTELAVHLCRCGVYSRILKAVKRAGEEMAG